MLIRVASAKETKKILSLSSRVIEESSMGFMKQSEHSATELFEPYLLNGAYYLVAIKNKRILGWLLVGWNMDQLSNEPIGCLLDVYVFPSDRRFGVAKKLMERSLQDLKKLGYRKVQLTVFSGNSSKNLCESFGFTDVFTLMEKEITDEWVME